MSVDSTTAQRVRIDSLVGGNPVDNNANVEDETWIRKASSSGRHFFSRRRPSAAETKQVAARIDGLQQEVRDLRQALEESRKKILEMEERQEAFWEEDVYDIVNNISSVSSTPPPSPPCNGEKDGEEPLERRDVATETDDSESFHTAVSSFESDNSEGV